MSEHPILPTGFNSTEIDGDESNGAGVNWSLIPVWTDQFTALTPLIITEEMLAVFDGCADFVIPLEDDTIVYPYEDVWAQADDNMPIWVAAPANNTIVWPYQRRDQKIREASP